MKKFFVICMMCFMGVVGLMAQHTATITFDTLTVDLGTFPETQAVREGIFHFTNTGNAPLIIHQVIATCGCTSTSFTEGKINPGEKGEIRFTYNGEGRMPGKVKKTINVRSNDPRGMTRLFFVGDMTADNKPNK